MSINVYQSALLAGLGAGALALFIAMLFMNDGRLPWAQEPPIVATRDNPLGIDAKVAYYHQNTGSTCPVNPPCDGPGFALKVTSKNANATVMGYQICVSSACASSEGLRHEVEVSSSPVVVRQNGSLSEEWSNAILMGPIQGWKAGDTADIIIQVKPAGSGGSGAWIELGESKILEFGRI